MAIRHPTRYQNQQKRRSTAWIGHLDALAEQARAKAAREERAKHPRKKQPRQIRIAQPLKPLNPHQK
jgi:hypothetical protein